MNNPLLSSTTDHQIAELRAQLPQAVLLKGPAGVGLSTIAKSIAGHNLASLIAPTSSDNEPSPEGGGEIRVIQIRNLMILTRGKSNSEQVFVIDNADRMNESAQNAFLKLLEEPNQSVKFILTAHAPDKLLSTITSRLQHVIVSPLSTEQTIDFLRSNTDATGRERDQLRFLAEGLPAEIVRLTTSRTYFEQTVTITTDARNLISGSSNAKLATVTKYFSDRTSAKILIGQTLKILDRTFLSKPDKQTHDKLQKLLYIYDKLELNANIRLTLLNFII
ncbi:MAG: AAA family ATPase [Candidatus Saccharimonas sp.]